MWEFLKRAEKYAEYLNLKENFAKKSFNLAQQRIFKGNVKLQFWYKFSGWKDDTLLGV